MNCRHICSLVICVLGFWHTVEAQHSVARQWSEVMLDGIRKDFARPPVHARNLFHVSIALYDAWAVYDDVAQTFLLGKTVGNYTCPFNGISMPANVRVAREEAISYAAYRVLKHRFQYSPGAKLSLARFDSLMSRLGYDTLFTSTDYSTGSPAALGNYIGQQVIDFGLQDGANEEFDYGNLYYEPANPPLDPVKYGDSTIVHPNRWQPITLGTFIDQNGNILPVRTPPFLCPEWGQVTPFALTPADRATHVRNGFNYLVYHDPGPPPYIDTLNPNGEGTQIYRWAFTLVSVWQSHHDPADSVMWDISPASIGNIQALPQTPSDLRNFYNLQNGGDRGIGRTINPRTGQPYQPQVVPRGDYARVLAEFWADGPSSETPPGHWFAILNYVNDNPALQKRFRGQGPILEDLEWDVKAYFTLGGAVHDAAISAWGIKGWYDYVRPISAIRWMADHGQCADPSLPGYSTAGIPLIPGFIEVVQPGDTLAGDNNRNVGKVKLYTWRGHDYIRDPRVNTAGAGWILAGKWWPYQRPTFVTPPFAGYVSGHSTYSRAAAEVMTLFTGDEYFPGGLGEYHTKKNEYLVFEDGPSVDVTLQWATYRDASDQCSLSRIWGGIHPPVDDIPGRLIGKKVGTAAFSLAERYFTGQATDVREARSVERTPTGWTLEQNYPNPFNPKTVVSYGIPVVSGQPPVVSVKIFDILGREVAVLVNEKKAPGKYEVNFDAAGLAGGVYFYQLRAGGYAASKKLLLLK